jgi:hypothetical protein
LSDCTAEPIGADRTPSNHDATVLVIQTLFGWVAESSALLAAMSPESAQAAVGAAH